MKKQKKLGRKLSLNKLTLTNLEQKKVSGGISISPICLAKTCEGSPCPCDQTVVSDACSAAVTFCCY